MAFVEGSHDGILNGATEVALVPAPASSTRRIVKSININNTDTNPANITVMFKNGSSYRTIIKTQLLPGDTIVLGEVDLYVLDAVNKSIVAAMSGAATTVNPDFVASYGDST